jgi:5-hmdU DNA kinase, helical domain
MRQLRIDLGPSNAAHTRTPTAYPVTVDRHLAPLSPDTAPGFPKRRRPPTPSVVFDTLWRFAVERQEVFLRRLAGDAPPWSSWPILQRHKFTNAYRASDRVSQYLIRHVIYKGDQTPKEVFFRTVLFKLFNSIETWELLALAVGTPSLESFTVERYDAILSRAKTAGARLYSSAYIMPPATRFGSTTKHTNYLRLLDLLLREDVASRLAEASSLEAAFRLLASYYSFGPFLAFQFTIDLNYGNLLNFDEMDFVVAGPGARDGISKCFSDLGDFTEPDIIRHATEHQDDHFSRLGLHFRSLWGRPLQLIDCQNLFCEVAKYARIAHPDFVGLSGRQRIKQIFRPSAVREAPMYPPKWGLNDRIASRLF